MADYSALKASVAAVIKTNNRREITGQLLQNVLTQMINVIGDNFQLAGFADPTTNPQSPDQNVFYIAEQSGVYPYFDNIVVPEGVTFLMWKNSQWTAHTIGVVTTEYLSENYVTKEFFRSMFRAYDSHGVEIEPNNDGDEPYTIDNIKAMVGFWTNEYISALGQGSGGGGGGGSTSLAGLTDVAINSETLAGGQGLVYNATTHKWVNGSVVVNMSSVWSALAASTNEQINASHLSAALTGFATQTWVNDNYISIAYFDRLFRAYNGNTLISHNDTTSTIDNIKAMFGFWTEQYLSALGNSGGGSVSLTLANMGDVALNNLADGQILVYDATSQKFVNESASIVGNYLPLTGGTLTGDLNLTQGVRIMSGEQAMLVYKPSGLTGISRTQWGVGAIDIQGVIRSSASDLLHRRGISGQSYAILDEYNVKTINGQSIYGTGNIEVGGGASGNYLPLSGGTLINANFGQQLTIKRDAPYDSVIKYTNSNGTLGYIGITSNRIPFFYSYSGTSRYFVFEDTTDVFLPLTGGTLTGRLTINASVDDVLVLNRTSASSVVRMDLAQGGTVYGNLGLDASHNIILRTTSSGTHTVRLQINTNGNVGIGTTSPNYKLHVNGTIGAGDVVVANIESEGYVSALSDIRKKDVVEYMDGLPIEQIASMRIIRYTWKDRPEEGLQVGSIAQDWQKILPESVHTTRKGFLSFADSRAALVASISNSRELVKHDERLTRIEKMLNINIA